MESMEWVNFCVSKKKARGTAGIIPADQLQSSIYAHRVGPAYHCAFDLSRDHLKVEIPTGKVDAQGRPIFVYEAQSPQNAAFAKTSKLYKGPARPAMGYAWFDFDHEQDPTQSLRDARAFLRWFTGENLEGCLCYYSGNKGFHIGVPFSYFGLAADEKTCEKLKFFALSLLKDFPSLDTTVYNPARKFRLPNSQHEKTKRYKLRLKDFEHTIEAIAERAAKPGDPNVPVPDNYVTLQKISDVLKNFDLAPDASSYIDLKEMRHYKQASGERAFNDCAFLSHVRDNPKDISEPQWYAAAGIIGRFKEGRHQFHIVSKKHPSYNANETDLKLEQALQASGPRTCEGIAKIFPGCTTCPLFQKIKSPVVILEKEIIATEVSGFYDIILSSNGAVKRVPNYNDLLAAFERDHAFKIIADMRSPFLFNGTHYEATTPIEIKSYAECKFDPAPKETNRQEFLNKVMANNVVRKDFFSTSTERAINFKNGVLLTASMELAPHNPDYGFRYVLPYNYDKNAVSPVFDVWMDGIMCGRKELVNILQEYMGYIVYGGDYIYHRALWLAGTGRNGKSTFISLIKDLVGIEACSFVSIKNLINDKFASVDLDGKLVNFSEETSPDDLNDSGPFKNLTGDGLIFAQRKYGDAYYFRNRAKMIMSYNDVPFLKDVSPGMLSRPIIIPFELDLTDAATQDKSIHAKLRAELPGIFNFAWKGWQRLQKQGAFSESKIVTEELDELRAESDHAYQWFERYVEITGNDDDFVTASDCFEHYDTVMPSKWRLPDRSFFRKLKNIAEMRKCIWRSKQVRGYRGIRLIENGTTTPKIKF